MPSANLPLSRSPLCTFTREALYKLLWSESTRTLSKRFGISDVGLAKACQTRKHTHSRSRVLGASGRRARM